MKDLKIVKVNNKLTTDSRDIALMVEKRTQDFTKGYKKLYKPNGRSQ
ncbi:hypothetical protein [Clostridioides difficile]|nr:hypothetical protein [Clostridioides difficile]